MGQCKDCKFWETTIDGTDINYCAAVDSANELAFIRYNNEFEADQIMLVTSPEFGCNQFEPQQKEETP